MLTTTAAKAVDYGSGSHFSIATQGGVFLRQLMSYDADFHTLGALFVPPTDGRVVAETRLYSSLGTGESGALAIVGAKPSGFQYTLATMTLDDTTTIATHQMTQIEAAKPFIGVGDLYALKVFNYVAGGSPTTPLIGVILQLT